MGMIVMRQTQGLKALGDLRAFPAGSQGAEVRTSDREAAYTFIRPNGPGFGA